MLGTKKVFIQGDHDGPTLDFVGFTPEFPLVCSFALASLPNLLGQDGGTNQITVNKT